ncbi:hypothetical protein C7M84_024099 [Penaeus vannamei]|uniref:Uncharacterized protein n=1 Tax=Penaeus vannamei TaxID=6689 RepID=A0A423U204_PENVA|nr:hypothetical protein C7M84_024099 [Penaeus vannamei]
MAELEGAGGAPFQLEHEIKSVHIIDFGFACHVGHRFHNMEMDKESTWYCSCLSTGEPISAECDLPGLGMSSRRVAGVTTTKLVLTWMMSGSGWRRSAVIMGLRCREGTEASLASVHACGQTERVSGTIARLAEDAPSRVTLQMPIIAGVRRDEGRRRWRCDLTVSRGRPVSVTLQMPIIAVSRDEGRRRWRCDLTVSRGRPVSGHAADANHCWPEDAPVSGHAADAIIGRERDEGRRRWRCDLTVSRGRPRLGSRCRCNHWSREPREGRRRWRCDLTMAIIGRVSRDEGRRRWRCDLTVSRGRPRLGSRCRCQSLLAEDAPVSGHAADAIIGRVSRDEGRRRWRCDLTVSRGRRCNPRLTSFSGHAADGAEGLSFPGGSLAPSHCGTVSIQ